MKLYLKKTMLVLFVGCLIVTPIYAQKIDAAYVKALYKKYPTKKSDFCGACKMWVNPYFKSIADTAKHMPLITYYVYTKAHRLQQEGDTAMNREKALAKWNSVTGQPDETDMYKAARDQNPGLKSSELLVKGHCQAWILLAYTPDAAIFSNTYTFNAALEYQGQNVGTEIATEERCRTLTGFSKSGSKAPVEAVADSVKIWCGTFGAAKTYTAKGVTATVPTHYYKILTYYDKKNKKNETECYWMPNVATEVKSKMNSTRVEHSVLVTNLGFDPMAVIKN